MRGVVRNLALVLPEKRYNTSNAVAKLQRLLQEDSFADCGRIVSAQVRSEDGTRAASDAIEELIEGPQPPVRNNGVCEPQYDCIRFAARRVQSQHNPQRLEWPIVNVDQ